jgi:8-oxo-dGTP diphosphatase
LNLTRNEDNGRHGVVAVIVEQGRFLVIRRSPWVRAPNLICLPGGGIEHGESFEAAMLRELDEELALRVDVISHLWTSVTRWGTKLEWLICRRHPGSEPQPNPQEVSEVL